MLLTAFLYAKNILINLFVRIENNTIEWQAGKFFWTPFLGKFHQPKKKKKGHNNQCLCIYPNATQMKP